MKKEEDTVFKAGDKIILALGPNQGSLGTFLGPLPDLNWAEIEEWNKNVRHHPLVWIRHFEWTADKPLGPQVRLALA